MVVKSQSLNSCVHDYRSAAALSAASSGRAEAIETMIRLSLTSPTPAVRNMASNWLAENCNVNVVREKGAIRATSAPANDLR